MAYRCRVDASHACASPANPPLPPVLPHTHTHTHTQTRSAHAHELACCHGAGGGARGRAEAGGPLRAAHRLPRARMGTAVGHCYLHWTVPLAAARCLSSARRRLHVVCRTSSPAPCPDVACGRLHAVDCSSSAARRLLHGFRSSCTLSASPCHVICRCWLVAHIRTLSAARCLRHAGCPHLHWDGPRDRCGSILPASPAPRLGLALSGRIG